MRENGGAHANEDANNTNAPLYVDYADNQLLSIDNSVAYPLARVKVKDSAFTTGVVGSTRANNITKGYHSLVTPDGMKHWSYMRNGDFVSNEGDVINGNGEKLSDALVYRGYSNNTDRTELQSGHYIVGWHGNDKLQAQFVAEAETHGLTLRTDIDYQLLQINSEKQDMGFLVGDASLIYLRVNDTGNNKGDQTSPNIAWTQLITNRNIASTTNVGAVKLAFTWKEETQNVVPVNMFRALIEKCVLVGDGTYDENTRGVSNLSNLEPWGSSAIGSVREYQNIESHVRHDAYQYGVILKLGQSIDTNAKIYIPHTDSKLHRDSTTRRLSCFYLRTSYQKNANDRGESDYKSDWFKYLSTDYFAGIPLPWPVQWVPEGFLAMNGATFDKRRYPRLAQLYPSGVLPDLRGEFIRGWDANRGVDRSRGLLSTQADAFQDHVHYLPTVGGDSYEWESNIITFIWDNTSDKPSEGAFVHKNAMPSNKRGNNFSIKEGGEVRTYLASKVPGDRTNIFTQRATNETRPRNVAFQYICYAA